MIIKPKVSNSAMSPNKKSKSPMQSMERRNWLGALIALPTLFITACGFKIRGMVSMSYSTIAITGNVSPQLRADLTSVTLTGSSAKVAKSPKDADLILEIISEISSREILAYNANGQISAYRLNMRVGFKADDKDGVVVVPESEIFVTRDLDFSTSTVLANDAQQAQFANAMRMEMALQILRRVSAAATPRTPSSLNTKPVMGKP